MTTEEVRKQEASKSHYFIENIARKSRSSNNSKSAGTILEYLFSFLESNEELNPVLSGYFNKVVEALFRRNPEKVNVLLFEGINNVSPLDDRICL